MLKLSAPPGPCSVPASLYSPQSLAWLADPVDGYPAAWQDVGCALRKDFRNDRRAFVNSSSLTPGPNFCFRRYDINPLFYINLLLSLVSEYISVV
jgi:hypothetical protein